MLLLIVQFSSTVMHVVLCKSIYMGVETNSVNIWIPQGQAELECIYHRGRVCVKFHKTHYSGSKWTGHNNWVSVLWSLWNHDKVSALWRHNNRFDCRCKQYFISCPWLWNNKLFFCIAKFKIIFEFCSDYLWRYQLKHSDQFQIQWTAM